MLLDSLAEGGWASAAARWALKKFELEVEVRVRGEISIYVLPLERDGPGWGASFDFVRNLAVLSGVDEKVILKRGNESIWSRRRTWSGISTAPSSAGSHLDCAV